jgi:hypothetical protein
LVDRKTLDPAYGNGLAALASCAIDAISMEYEQLERSA